MSKKYNLNHNKSILKIYTKSDKGLFLILNSGTSRILVEMFKSLLINVNYNTSPPKL